MRRIPREQGVSQRPGKGRLCRHARKVRRELHGHLPYDRTGRKFRAGRRAEAHYGFCEEAACRRRRRFGVRRHNVGDLNSRRDRFGRAFTRFSRRASDAESAGMVRAVYYRLDRYRVHTACLGLDTGDLFPEARRQNGDRRQQQLYVESPSSADGVLLSAHGGRRSAAQRIERVDRRSDR